MATPAEVEAAVRALAERLADVEPAVLNSHGTERTVSCKVSDLGVLWSGLIGPDGLTGLTPAPAELDVGPRAQVRLTVTSDDLLALSEGRLAPSTAWASGRLRVQASARDLLRLRALL